MAIKIDKILGEARESDEGVVDVDWGDIDGNLSNQTDLQTALDGKVNDTGDTMTGDLAFDDASINNPNKITFNALYTPNGENVGTLYWNPADGTLDVKLYNDVTLQTGQELHFYGKASEDIEDGDVVQYAGFQGDHILFKKAVGAEVDAQPELLLGLATQDIDENDWGYVTWFGQVRNVYTYDWEVNDILYFDKSNGHLTNVAPTAPDRKIYVAAVQKVQTGTSKTGVLLVRPTWRERLSELSDITLTDLANNDILYWNENRWENRPLPEHNDLSGLQGGTSDEYYHLTSEQIGNLHAPGSDDQDLSGLVPYTGATGNLDLGEFNLEAKVVDAKELSVGEVVSDLTPQVDMGVSLGAPNAKYLSVVTSELAFDSDIGITVDTEANSMNVEAESVSFIGDITANNLSGTNTGDQDLSGYQLTSEKGQANGYASLDAGGKVPVSELPNSIMQYVGVWDASTNSPTLADGAGNDDEDIGDVYRVSVAGTQNLGSGNITFNVGDYVILSYNKIWEKSDTTDSIASVFGRTGVVTAQSNDYTLSQIATRDHDLLSGLTDDDHTQYALLDGRSSGQTLTGGVNASGTLTLRSTSNATKGKILFGTSAYDEANNRLGLGKNNPSYQLDATGVGAFGGGLRVDADTNTAFDALYFRNSNNGATALSRASFRTDAGETLIIDNFSSGYSGTIGGIPYAGLVRLTARAASSALMIGTETTAEPFYLATANTVRATITGTGNVGIGTAGPVARLTVEHADTTTYSPTTIAGNGLYLRNTNNSAVGGNLNSVRFQTSSNNGASNAFGAINLIQPTNGSHDSNFSFQLRNSGGTYSEIMRMLASGNVGIGTTSPAGKLEIYQSSTTGAIPVLKLYQADVSEEFIEFVATSASDNTNPISTTAVGTYAGKLRVNVNGTYYWIAYYNS